jgi:uncharacterized membrane protein YfcA
MTELLVVVVLVGVAASFFVSSAAGLGGSLVLIPTLSLALGTKEGVALGALLLGANNVVKLVLYREVLPWRAAAGVIALTVAGTYVGARALVATPEDVVTGVVIVSFAVALIAERRRVELRRVTLAPVLAFGSGATSGFSGTSGPLKGVAVRSLSLDRMHTVGAASLASAFGDLTKTAVFTDAEILTAESYWLMAAAVPVMLVASLAGRRFTTVIGEQGYERLFWLVMGGYTARLLSALG